MATHMLNRKNIETLANLVFINQSSTSLVQRNTSLTMRSITGQFLDFFVADLIQFDVFW